MRSPSTPGLLAEFEEVVNRSAPIKVALQSLSRDEGHTEKVSLQAVSPWYWNWHNNPIREAGEVTLEYKCQALGDKAFRLWMIARVVRGALAAEKEVIVRLDDIGSLSVRDRAGAVATLTLALRNSVVLKGTEYTNERNPTRNEISILRQVDIHFAGDDGATQALHALKAALDAVCVLTPELVEWDRRPIIVR